MFRQGLRGLSFACQWMKRLRGRGGAEIERQRGRLGTEREREIEGEREMRERV